jgi:AcrR family transcriptional regulator
LPLSIINRAKAFGNGQSRQTVREWRFAMRNQKEDRRSQRTRQMLHRALFELMSEKRYDSITVQDIIDRANVGRSTFYAHYQDKEDLAMSGLEHMLDRLSEDFGQGTSKGERIVYTVRLFQHVQEQQQLFKALVMGRGFDLFFEKGQAYLSKRIETQVRALLPKGQKSQVPLPIVSNHVAGALVTLLKWWLDNKLPYAPERMDEIFHQLVMPSIRSAIDS